MRELILDFSHGFTAPFRALKLIATKRRLLLFSLLPVALTIIFVVVTFFAIIKGAVALSQAWFHQSMVGGIFAAISGIIALYVIFSTLQIILSLCASPFNDQLAVETEKVCHILPKSFGALDFVKVFFIDLRKTVLTLTLSAGLWISSLLPGLGLLAPFGFAMVTTLTFISYPQSRRHLGVIACLGWIKNNFAASLGFGFATLLLFGIPLVDFFALPISVVGGTLLYLENEKRRNSGAADETGGVPLPK